MFQVQIDAECSDTHIEVLPSEVETAECMIEELVGQLLLEDREHSERKPLGHR